MVVIRKGRRTGAWDYGDRQNAKLVIGRRPKKLNRREKRQVKRMIDIGRETKFLTVNQSATSATNVFQATLLTNIVQGSTSADRDGDSLLIKYIRLRYQIINADTYNFVRVVIVQWRENDALAAIAGASIFDVGQTGVIDFNSHYDWLQRRTYHILYDRVHYVANGISSDKQSVVRSVNIRPKVHKINYNAGAVTASDNIYLLWISDSAAVTHPTLSFTARTYFTDA